MSDLSRLEEPTIEADVFDGLATLEDGSVDVPWHCIVTDTTHESIPSRCESGSSMAPGHEDCHWDSRP